jgi:hypothetical protein
MEWHHTHHTTIKMALKQPAAASNAQPHTAKLLRHRAQSQQPEHTTATTNPTNQLAAADAQSLACVSLLYQQLPLG